MTAPLLELSIPMVDVPDDGPTPIWDHMVGVRFDLPPGWTTEQALSAIAPLVPISVDEVTLAMRAGTVVASDHDSDQCTDQEQTHAICSDNSA